jgi:hypothetical protein
VLLSRTQQVQPASIMVHRQSQQAWIISQHFWSPEVQVRTQPDSVMSHLHMAMVKLQQQTIMPFMRQQQLHMPPASIVHRFCTMLQAILSSHEQVILHPPWHFSTFTVPRGTTIQFVPVGTPVGVVTGEAPRPGTPIPGTPIPVRSSIIALDMKALLSRRAAFAGRP